MNNKIPFLDLVSPCNGLEDEFRAVFESVISTAHFIGGPMVQSFENEFAAFSNAKHCAGLSSGTDAVRFALMASGVKQGDVVLTVPNTFIATTESISQAGAHIEFVEIDERTYNISIDALHEFATTKCTQDLNTGNLISKKYNAPITAVVPVHLYGQVAGMDGITAFAEKYNLAVVEDACQAHGAEYYSEKKKSWLTAGSIGNAAAFSFYPGKNLGAMGEGGAATSNDESIIHHIKTLRDHGQSQKYIHEMEGYNGRLDALQAGILSIKLKRLVEWNKQRKEIASIYNELLADVKEVVTPYDPEGCRSVYHLYVIRISNRVEIQKFLMEQGIATGLHYPVPLHLQKAYEQLGYQKGDFALTETISEELLSLPVFPGLQREQVERVVRSLKMGISKNSVAT